MRGRKMNSSFNYSGFIEMFLNSDDEFEPYGLIDNPPHGADIRHNQSNQPPHRDKLIIDPGED